MNELLRDYNERKKEIKDRLKCFRHIHKKNDRDVFSELCFCLLTPQSKAVACDVAIKKLEKEGGLLKGSQGDIKACLNGVRFPNNKARYIVEARRVFKNCKEGRIKHWLHINDISKTRDWLVNNVKGLGYKEASHFLRNIGLGRDLAILDRHILKNLKKYKVIKTIPKSLSRKKYIEIEEKMRLYFKKLGIPMEDVDLLFWSRETGMIFK